MIQQNCLVITFFNNPKQYALLISRKRFVIPSVTFIRPFRTPLASAIVIFALALTSRSCALQLNWNCEMWKEKLDRLKILVPITHTNHLLYCQKWLSWSDQVLYCAFLKSVTVKQTMDQLTCDLLTNWGLGDYVRKFCGKLTSRTYLIILHSAYWGGFCYVQCLRQNRSSVNNIYSLYK